MSETEAANFRAYLQKGGFVIFDDFAEVRGEAGLGPFEYAFRQVAARGAIRRSRCRRIRSFMPSSKSIPLISFRRRTTKAGLSSAGVFEDNDPSKRLIAMINYNTDISEYWEFSDTGLRPIDESNEAYKIGVNYIMYGMTH